MGDPGIREGTWLLIDAAGPRTGIGLVADKGWRASLFAEVPFLECGPPGIQEVLTREDLKLTSLSGVLYAAGPGSTLGLRLAAMFIRTLLQLPQLAHWQCFSYNNLVVAALDRRHAGKDFQLLAPWKKNRWHRVTVRGQTPCSLELDSIATQEINLQEMQFTALGNRRADFPTGARVHPYELSVIPQILAENPSLLTVSQLPGPYLAELPQFLKWSSQRHRGGPA